MGNRSFASLVALAVLAAVISLAPVPLAGQPQAAAVKKSEGAKSWVPPRTVDGQPDLQGVWANNSATPLQRPKALAGKQSLTNEEMAALKQKAGELFKGDGDAAFGDQVFQTALAKSKNFISSDGKTGDYNHFWLVERDFDNRTSLITDPQDGRVPQLTTEAEKKLGPLYRFLLMEEPAPEGGFDFGRADSWEDRGLSERCITFGTPEIFAGYNSYYQIFQTPGYVVIATEKIHDARIVPLDGRPHISQNIRQWLGDSRGHWEGNTLVVETTNFSPKSNFMGSSDKLHAVERFTRVGPNTINYEVTVDDPTTWTKPWTLMIPWKQSQDNMYEYACHEGNEGMHGILAGARAQEKAAEGAAKSR